MCLLGLLALTACSNTVLLTDDPWTPCSLRVFPGHSREADREYANLKKKIDVMRHSFKSLE